MSKAIGGTARGHFQCGAGSQLSPSATALCNNQIVVDLYNDGQYDGFCIPEGWHIALGLAPVDTVVRCPSHCTFVGKSLADGGYWQDAPAP